MRGSWWWVVICSSFKFWTLENWFIKFVRWVSIVWTWLKPIKSKRFKLFFNSFKEEIIPLTNFSVSELVILFQGPTFELVGYNLDKSSFSIWFILSFIWFFSCSIFMYYYHKNKIHYLNLI